MSVFICKLNQTAEYLELGFWRQLRWLVSVLSFQERPDKENNLLNKPAFLPSATMSFTQIISIVIIFSCTLVMKGAYNFC